MNNTNEFPRMTRENQRSVRTIIFYLLFLKLYYHPFINTNRESDGGVIGLSKSVRVSTTEKYRRALCTFYFSFYRDFLFFHSHGVQYWTTVDWNQLEVKLKFDGASSCVPTTYYYYLTTLLPTYLPTSYLPSSYLPTYLPTYLPQLVD
jgi:hypothetical protein